MLFTKCILSEPVPEDGLRISIMSRHTLNDGKTPDVRIKHFHRHLPSFGPSPNLIGRYYRKEISWDVFERNYLEQLRAPLKARAVKKFAMLALFADITVLCIEQSADHCHRRLFAEECQRHESELVVEHR